jgi:hypothetical protein
MTDPKNGQQQYLGVGIALGVAIGSGLGMAMHNLALGIGCGVAIGVALGVGRSSAKRPGNDDARKGDTKDSNP